MLGAVCIGIMPHAAKLTYGEGVSLLGLLVLRSAIGASGLAIFLWARREKLLVPRSYVPKTAAAGVALLIATGGGMGAVAYIDVTVDSVIFFTYPIFVAIVNHLRGTTRLSLAEIILIAMAFVGVALALGLRKESLDGLNYNGLGLVFLSSVGITPRDLDDNSDNSRLGCSQGQFAHQFMWSCLLLRACFGLAGARASRRDGLSPDRGGVALRSSGGAWLHARVSLFFCGKDPRGDQGLGPFHSRAGFHDPLCGDNVCERLSALQTTGFLIVVVALVGFELVSARKG